MIPDAPIVRLLIAAEAAMNRPDYAVEAGAAAKVTIRHARNRNPIRSERPAITLVFVTASPTQGDIGVSMDEVQWKATIDLQADIELATEASKNDPTALAVLSRMLAVALNALRNPAYEMALMCDWVEMVEIDPEDRTTPDDGRLVYAVNVVYRTLSTDENVLLAQGVSG